MIVSATDPPSRGAEPPGNYASGVDGVRRRRKRGVNTSAGMAGARVGGVDAVLGETLEIDRKYSLRVAGLCSESSTRLPTCASGC